MPQTVEISGGRTVEFPDDFTPDQMNAEILKAFPELRTESTMATVAKALPGMATFGAAMAKQELPEDVSLVNVPEFGEPGTFTRGVSKVAKSVVEGAIKPSGFALMGAASVPGVGAVIGATMTALAGKETIERGAEAIKTGSPEAWGEATGMGVATVAAGLGTALDVMRLRKAPATAAALERTVTKDAETIRTGEGPLSEQGTVPKGVEGTRGPVVERPPSEPAEPVAPRAEATEVNKPAQAVPNDWKLFNVSFDERSNRYRIVPIDTPRKGVSFIDPTTKRIYFGPVHGEIYEAVRINEGRKLVSNDRLNGFFTGERFVDRTPERRTVELQSEASAGVKALAVEESKEIGSTTRSTPPPAKAEEGARETATLKSQQNKPVPPSTEQAPVSPAPTAAAVSEAKPTGVAAPEVPPAISKTTTTGEIQQTEPLRGPTSIKNAQVDAERVARGLEPMEPRARREWGTVWDDAMAIIDRDPTVQERLVRELEKSPRALTDTEDALLAHRRREVKNEHIKATDELFKAVDEGRTGEISSLQERVAYWESELVRNDNVDTLAGTQSGRGLAFRKAMINEDFSLARLSSIKRAAKPGAEPLTLGELTEVKRVADEYKQKSEALEKLNSEQETRIAELEAERAVKAMARETKASEYVIKVAEKIVGALEKQADSARKRLAGKFLTPSPADMRDVAIIGASHIARLGLNFAKWSARMIEDVGQGIRPYLQEVYEASQRHLDSVADSVAPVPQRKKATDRLKSQENAQDIAAKVKARAEQEGLEATGNLIQKMARQFVAEGEKTVNGLVDKVHAVLVESLPDITKSEVRDAISGYGKFKQLSKDAIDVTLRDLKGQMQQIAKLEDMEAGLAPRKTGVERRTPSDDERRLIKQVNESKKAGGFEITDPETQLRSALQAIKTRLENQIKDLEHQLETKTKIVRERRPAPSDAEVTELRLRRDQLREQYDAMFPKEPATDAQRLARWKQVTTTRMAKLQKQIAEGDFTTRKREPVNLDAEATRLEFELDEIKRKFYEGVLQEKLRQQTGPQKLLRHGTEGINVTRAILTSADLSAVLRQGGFITFAHPIRSARNIPAMLRAFRSRDAQFAIEREIRQNPDYSLARQAGLELTEHGGVSLTKMEEAYMSRLAEKIPVVAGSQRAYITFLNKLRMDSFSAMRRTMSRDGQNISPIEARVIANYINVATGRGTIGVRNNMAVGLATVFFAPRFVASRFQLALGQPLYHGLFSGKVGARGTARARKLVAMEYARFLTGAAIMYGLGKMAGAEIEPDPRSSDFGKLRFGETRIDLMSGLQQGTVFLAREVSGETKSISGQITPIRGDNVPYGKATGADIAGRFLRTKLSPVFGTTVDIASGENVVGEPVTPAMIAKRNLIPISLQDVYDTMVEQGVPKGTAMSMLSIFGAGVQTFD